MTETQNESSNHIIISPPVFYFLLSAAVAGGAGSYGIIGPQLEAEAISACFDNSQTALNVAAQHGQELLTLRQEDNRLQRLIEKGTVLRYTSADAEKNQIKQERRDDGQDRRLRQVERHIDKGEDRR